MSVRDVAAYRKVHLTPADKARKLTQRVREVAARMDGQIEAHYREVEADVKAARELADAEEQLALKQVELAQLELRRGRKL